jgi:hypothetical protein
MKPVRLKGRALAEFNTAVHERDDNRCIVCGAYVPDGVKFHHERSGLKSDVIEECVTLCYHCHQERHFGDVRRILKKCRDYLACLYSERWNGRR